MIAVSSCLAGIHCRYDGDCKADAQIMELVAQGKAVCICPECLGGMPTPRLPSEIVGGDGGDVLHGKAKVLNSEGCDVTECFVSGAYAMLGIIKEHCIERAILKARSPSCGAGEIYDGSFCKRIKQGDGVAAALLRSNGIQVEVR
ncbi:MAG: DUF523 domain-containing protein [Clostridia bacterium]